MVKKRLPVMDFHRFLAASSDGIWIPSIRIARKPQTKGSGFKFAAVS
jgi:hypothetical protein